MMDSAEINDMLDYSSYRSWGMASSDSNGNDD